MVRAVVGTPLTFAGCACPPFLALALAIDARAVDGALALASGLVAVDACPTSVTVARAVETESMVAACRRADSQATIVVGPPWCALAYAIDTRTIAPAVMRAFAVLPESHCAIVGGHLQGCCMAS